tara:strand:- start:188 stop:385 length:198 start_codon:yes stop_codon:yes gene_type:complete
MLGDPVVLSLNISANVITFSSASAPNAIFSLDAISFSNLVSAAFIFLSVSPLKKSLSPFSSLALA